MRCTFCGYENSEGNVRELTRTEKNFFNGVTIDADSQEGRSSEENFRRQGRTYDFSTRRTYVNFGGSNILYFHSPAQSLMAIALRNSPRR